MFRCMFLLVLVILKIAIVGCLECYSCQNVSDPKNCNTTVECLYNQACFVQSKNMASSLVFDMGCQDNTQCSVGGTNAGSNLIGRAIRQTTNCHECCSAVHCNQQLCIHNIPSACVDDASFDCARVNSLTHFCQDIHHAKLVCPKFCDLCDLVDGSWASWSHWSSCDVTCSNGTRSRTRSCTDPGPANGGLDCIGYNTDYISCTRDKCPVHGAWSKWSPWGECSVTCGVGIQRRDRSCSNPYPDRFGDHCFGESRDDIICMSNACADGKWSAWLPWEQCSVTCGEGIRKRHRSCDSPAPSSFGRACVGNNEEADSCNNGECDAVAFDVYHVVSMNGIGFVFDTVLINEGHGYNQSTGYFTAPQSGLYSFTAKMCVDNINGHDIGFEIRKLTTNNNTVLDKSYGYQAVVCVSANTITRLDVNDRVAVFRTSGSLSYLAQGIYRQCSFTGAKLSS